MFYVKKKLSEICDIVIGRTPHRNEPTFWGKGYKWASISDMKGEIIVKTKEEITNEAINSISCYKVAKGTLLMSFKLTIGKLSFAGVDLYTNEAIAALPIKDDSILWPKYLYYALRVTNFKGGNNAVMGRTLNLKSLSEIQIPLPPLSEQIQIAGILTQAETLIAQRKESIRLLDELVKSQFLEMFGDPVKNEKGWEVKRLGDYIFDIIAGSSYGGESTDEELNEDEFGVIKVSAVTWGTFNPKEFKVVKKNNLKGKVYHPKKDDLLFSRANTKELVGATCIVDKDYPKLFLPDKIWSIKLKESELQKVFLHYLLKNNFFRKILTKDATGTSGSMLNISMDKFQNILFCKPPFDLQMEFTKLVNSIQRQKDLCQESLKKIESLYSSLSQKAFRGELTFEKESIALNESKLLESDVAKETASQPRKQNSVKTKNPKIIQLKPTNVDFYKRTVLAAEIVWQLHREPTFGHLKLQKLLFLCIRSSNMQLPVNFTQQAMGPYDNRMMRSIDKQLQEKKWFLYDKDKSLKYEPLNNAGQHQADFQKYYFSEQENIFSLIKKFRTTKSDTVEIVATLYACLENMIEQKETFSESLLLKKFYDWSDRKKVFDELEVRRVFKRMKDSGILPKGI
ncbi:restriction endonuclease subunit S [Leptospira kirschneri]|uniref:restriction endonuclease subunit S n=1 Tax=Leptospira kirschneri TaxID=29507 RepID=UPI0021C66E91|nr:restriction endonuclease subunit S [Leptospira kirschneri]UML81909.1 restriction endonuclease subunit S [Leptospira kirschneri]